MNAFIQLSGRFTSGFICIITQDESPTVSLQDIKNRRNPRLVPYVLLDERTKKSNKDSLREAVRTLLGYGYNLEAPDQDHGTMSLTCCPLMPLLDQSDKQTV